MCGQSWGGEAGTRLESGSFTSSGRETDGLNQGIMVCTLEVGCAFSRREGREGGENVRHIEGWKEIEKER